MKRGTQPIEFQVPGSRWSLARRAMINDDRTRIVVKKRTSLLVLPGNPRKGCQFPLNVSTWALCPLRAAFGAVIVGRINRTRTTLLLSLCVPRVAASKRFRTFWTKKMPPLLTRQSRFWTCDTKASWMDEARVKKSQVKNHRKKDRQQNGSGLYWLPEGGKFFFAVKKIYLRCCSKLFGQAITQSGTHLLVTTSRQINLFLRLDFHQWGILSLDQSTEFSFEFDFLFCSS